MVLLFILFILLMILAVLAVAALVIGGTVGIVLFGGDMFICIFVTVWLIKTLIKKRKNRDD